MIATERAADCALDEIAAQARQWQREHRRPPALTPREALKAIRFECLLLWTAWHNLLNGVELSDDDSERLTLAMRRIEAICEEADGWH